MMQNGKGTKLLNGKVAKGLLLFVFKFLFTLKQNTFGGGEKNAYDILLWTETG
jgi:hypothetical protein